MMKIYLTLLTTTILSVNIVMSTLLTDTKPSADPRHNNDYYKQLTIPVIKDQMRQNMQYVGRMMDSAQAILAATGLSVPNMLYTDAREFVLKTLAPETLCALDACQSEQNKTLFAMIAREVYGFRHMSDRIFKERQQRSVFNTTTGAAYEQQLWTDLKAREESLFQALTYIADVKSRGPNGFEFLIPFHKMIYTFLVNEYPKINQAIQKLPTSQLRIKNMQLLLDDFLLLTQEPW